MTSSFTVGESEGSKDRLRARIIYLRHALGRCQQLVDRGRADEGLALLADKLGELHAQVDDSSWRVAALAFQRLFDEQPYALPASMVRRGDGGRHVDYATLIDIFCDPDGAERHLEALPEPTRALIEALSRRPLAAGCRKKSAVVEEGLRRCIARFEHPRILALGAGYLRELDISGITANGSHAEIYAFDDDPSVVQALEARKGLALHSDAVTPTALTRRFAKQGGEPDGLAFAYSVYCIDRLSTETAQKLCAHLFARLAPGGRLLLCNAHPACSETPLAEALLGWWFERRDEAGLRELVDGLPGEEVDDLRVWREEGEGVAFAEVARR